MLFRLSLIIVALTLCLVDSKWISRRGHEQTLRGGWKNIEPSQIPPEVMAFIQQKINSRINSTQGVRMVSIVRAKSQVVSGVNYEVIILCHETDCPASASPQQINDEAVCHQIRSITCYVKVHRALDQTITLHNIDCLMDPL
jgi:hypothetical protein